MEVSSDKADSTETDEVDVGEYSDEEAEEEVRHEGLGVHHVDNHCITNYYDETTGNLKTAGDNFRNGSQHSVNGVRTSNSSNDSSRNSYADTLQQQTADMAHFNTESIAFQSKFIS